MSSLGIFGGTTEQNQGRASGVAVAVVINNQDPQGLGRVQVKLPNYSDLDIGHWARVAVLMAGNQRGSFFLPEVGDEVLVAFEGGDLERPFILGGLWNGQDNPPDTNADGQNNKRFFKSRSGHLVRFDDTDGAEKIEIIDKSGNNSITFDTTNNTITITSAQDITLDASQGTIKLTAQKVSISSTSDTSIDAQGELKLNASSTTTIKGTQVNIN